MSETLFCSCLLIFQVHLTLKESLHSLPGTAAYLVAQRHDDIPQVGQRLVDVFGLREPLAL